MSEIEKAVHPAAESQEDTWENLVLTREQWHPKAEELFREAREKGLPLSALFVDLDYFKSVNDVLGHDVGDTVIEDIRDLLTIMVRSFRTANGPGQERELDVVAAGETHPPIVNGEPLAGHVGGDEFTVLAATDAAGAQAIAQRLRSIYDDYINNPQKPERAKLRELGIDLAIGVATLTPQMQELSDLLRTADQSMYEDKLSKLELDEHQKHAVRLAGKVLKAAGVRMRDVPKIIRMHPELLEED